jgi:tetratricopeptide (TPR) repeat protein
MKVLSVFPFAGIALFSAWYLFPQSASAQNARARLDSSVVHVQELAMPPKAARAFEKGTALLHKHEPQASLVYFQKAIELAPNLFPPYHNLAIAHYNLGHLEDAADNFKKAIDLSKGSFAPSFFGLAMVSFQCAQFAEAQRLVQQGLLVEPGSAVGKLSLGLTQYSLGQTVDAQQSALEALRIDPHIGAAHLLLAHIHERLHDPNAVVADVDSCLKNTSNNNVHAEALALLQRAQRDLARASLD